MIAVRGADSVIVHALLQMPVAKHDEVIRVGRGEEMPLHADRYLFAAGTITQEPVRNQSKGTIENTFWVNCGDVIAQVDRILEANSKARICVVGSESGFKGSFDQAYASAKAGLHRYVETRRLGHPGQQLVCVAPTCIVPSGMTKRRNVAGRAAMARREVKHPKRRWLKPEEVAGLIHYVLYQDSGYLTNVVIRLNGGEHCA